MRVLISGIGVAGPTLAWWLKRYGFEPTLIEHAPALRRGGYVVDFWGAGYDVAQRMGLEAELHRLGYEIDEVRMVDAQGRSRGGFSAEVFRRIMDGRFTTIPRTELAGAIYRSLDDRVETLFGDSITTLRQDDSGVRVEFEQAPARQFDLVIGADGLHSRVRKLTFGASPQFEKPLGYTVAAFGTRGYQPRDERVYVGYARPGQQIARFSMREDLTMFLFVFAHDLTTDGLPDLAGCKRILHAQFDDAGWECPQILAALDTCEEVYFDRVSQIRIPAWSSGRVALLGDAASCPSLLAGQGAALAMIQAYVLAGELHAAHGDHRLAFAAYERRLREFIDTKQRDAAKFAGSFAPKTRFGLVFRSWVTRLFAIPGVARFALRRSLIDRIDLPDYA